jgi:hypothetical protein
MDHENPFVPGSKGKYSVCVHCLGTRPQKADK